MSTTPVQDLSFAELDLPAFLLETLNKVGYEKPSPIQQATIPALLQGNDIVGMAQTGTGKTAAFALPVLAHIDVTNPKTQALVLCPTRELAIQVAEAFQTYAQGMRGFHVLPVYGGQEMGRQLQALRRGVHVVVATPGRLLDHLNRKSLDLGDIKTLVLDEADEMLRMGFIDDVELILQKTPSTRQVALFSATMPPVIRRVAEKYLRSPIEVSIKTATSTNANIEQFYWLVQGTNKLDALTRMLEVEEFDGMIIFVRTKNSTQELADKLNARGFSAAALNGDMNQQLRTRTVEQLKNGQLDIVVATDVAARGLDVERISHVMNYDIPYDNETYVHRIGRTGRAGRSGKAILFVAPREQRMLQSIERTTRKKVTRMELPTRGELILHRSQQFKDTIAVALENDNLDFFRGLITDLCSEHDCSVEDAAAAMAWLLQKDRPLEPSFKDVGVAKSGYGKTPAVKAGKSAKTANNTPDVDAFVASARDAGTASAPADKPARKVKSKPPMQDLFGELNDNDFTGDPVSDRPARKRREAREFDDGEDVALERFRIKVGHEHGVTPREIVGAVANEGGIEGRYIGRIQIYDDHTTIDLPAGMPDDVFQILQRTRVCNQALDLERMSAAESAAEKDTRPERKRPAFNKDRRDAGGSDFKKPAFRKEGFKKEVFKKEGFKKGPSAAGGFKKEGFKSEGAKPEGFRKNRPDRSDGPPAAADRPIRRTREDFSEPSSAPAGAGDDKRFTPKPKAKKRGGPKVRMDKDKGKRRTPSKKP
ncbi:DEAD/DEAH box helicase [Pseudohongiella sp.]|uniref:RNA helicase n=1 Tax=marine sediment metagenome TaxID=412755 RepID=A0A0F9VH97_9ZZZZ|nr:DEAD/DEAH box helicase [Pseudohongiella sp.]